MTGCNNAACQRVPNLFWKLVAKTITVIKFEVNTGGNDGTGCLAIKIRQIQ